jgi:hypothetical protein
VLVRRGIVECDDRARGVKLRIIDLEAAILDVQTGSGESQDRCGQISIDANFEQPKRKPAPPNRPRLGGRARGRLRLVIPAESWSTRESAGRSGLRVASDPRFADRVVEDETFDDRAPLVEPAQRDPHFHALRACDHARSRRAPDPAPLPLGRERLAVEDVLQERLRQPLGSFCF